jgi:hypothetical protein
VVAAASTSGVEAATFCAHLSSSAGSSPRRFVYIGTHPCFVGPTQEHGASGVPHLHRGYRRGGRWRSAEAPGTTPGGWRERLGSFNHLPLGDFLCCFAGFTIDTVEELADGYEYPKTMALSFTKP